MENILICSFEIIPQSYFNLLLSLGIFGATYGKCDPQFEKHCCIVCPRWDTFDTGWISPACDSGTVRDWIDLESCLEISHVQLSSFQGKEIILNLFPSIKKEEFYEAQPMRNFVVFKCVFLYMSRISMRDTEASELNHT